MNPKLTKFRGGYSADAELVFCSWHVQISWHTLLTVSWITRQLSNSSKTKHWIMLAMRSNFNLTSAGGKILYEDLLRHLSITFQGGNDEANILAKFYSHSQRAKELEEVFADELQLLAQKVISKKPDFQVNLDTMLKQWYTNQLYDCNSASIAKMLLLQMPKVSFTQFRNELARVLGTHQHSSKTTTKSIATSTVGVESEEEGTVSKSQHRQG